MVEIAEKLEPLATEGELVAVDNGYADQKIAFFAETNGKKSIKEVLIPSRAQMGAINTSVDGIVAGVYEVDGDSWTVGKDVSDPESITGPRYAHSELNAVLVNHSLIAAGYEGKDVQIATGLPFSHFFRDDGEPDSEFLNKVRESLKVSVNPRTDSLPANITKHNIYPESTAAHVDFFIDDQGNMIHENHLGVAVVDVGGNTTDVTYINSDNTINKERSGSRKLGVLNVRSRLRSLISNDFDVQNIRDAQLDHALRTGKCSIFGTEKDVKKQIEQAKRESAKKLFNYVEEKVGDAADLDHVIFVGGGADVLSDIIKQYPNSKVPDNPQFANARGMLKYMAYLS